MSCNCRPPRIYAETSVVIEGDKMVINVCGCDPCDGETYYLDICHCLPPKTGIEETVVKIGDTEYPLIDGDAGDIVYSGYLRGKQRCVIKYGCDGLGHVPHFAVKCGLHCMRFCGNSAPPPAI